MVAAAQGLSADVHHAREHERRARRAARRVRRRGGADPGREGMARRDRAAQELAETHGRFMPPQFDNPANPEVHRRTTAQEIWDDTGGAVDVLVAGVGTGGTVTGVGQVLKEKRPGITSWRSSPPSRRCSRAAPPAPHGIQGIGAGFVPERPGYRVYDEVRPVTSRRAVRGPPAGPPRGNPRRHIQRRGAVRRSRVPRVPSTPRRGCRGHPSRHRRAIPQYAAVPGVSRREAAVRSRLTWTARS